MSDGRTHMRKAQPKWRPLGRLIGGIIVKPFLPLKKHPELSHQNAYFFNLYPGDEIYVFEETEDSKWCRAYYCWKPLPEDYISSIATTVDGLPDIKSKVAVFPRKFANLRNDEDIATMPSLKLPEPKDFESTLSEDCTSLSLSQMLSSGHFTDNEVMNFQKPSRPSFPYFRDQQRPFIEEMNYVLALICSHIYWMYSVGRFDIYKKLVNLYYKLDNIRSRLQYGLTTESENITTIRAANSLLVNISKFISSKNRTNRVTLNSEDINSDPSGFQGIFARDINTGELLSYEQTDLQTLMTSTMLYGLSNNFPIANTDLLEDNKPKNPFFSHTQSNILVDVKDITDSINSKSSKLTNVTVSIYLRTKEEILTEAITMDINLEHMSKLNNISAALFHNIPGSKTENLQVFLVAEITEDVTITSIPPRHTTVSAVHGQALAPTNSGSCSASSLPSECNRLSTIKKGVAAGVIDISRIFSSNTGSLATSVPYHFKIHLFGSYNPSEMSESSDFEDGFGWGTIVSKIMSNSGEGIAVNPRATSISINIKEIKGNLKPQQFPLLSNVAIKTIPTYFYDSRSSPNERIYLKLLGVKLLKLNSKITRESNIVIKVGSKTRHLSFKRSINEEKAHSWNFTAVRSGEIVGETIIIDDLKNLNDEEQLEFKAYADGRPIAKAYIFVMKHGKITDSEIPISLKLLSKSKKPAVEIQYMPVYKGKHFNLALALQDFTKIDTTVRPLDSAAVKDLIQKIQATQDTGIHQQMVNFELLLRKYLEILFLINSKENSALGREVHNNIFNCFLNFVEATLLPDESPKHILFNMYKTHKDAKENLQNFPSVGCLILSYTADIFAKSDTEWDIHSERLTKTVIYLLAISIITSAGISDEWTKSLDTFMNSTCFFFKLRHGSIYPYQISVLRGFHLWLDILADYIVPETLMEYMMQLVTTCKEKESIIKVSKSKLLPIEEEYLNTKLIAMRKILDQQLINHWLFHSNTKSPLRPRFIAIVLEWVFQPFLPLNSRKLKIPAIRLASGILITLLESITDEKILRHTVRLLPLVCSIFILVRKHFKQTDLLTPKRTFTKLFLSDIPSTNIVMDSIISSEVVVEVLLELGTVISEISKITEKIYGKEASLGDIINDCADDVYFKSDIYLQKITKTDIKIVMHTVQFLSEGEFFPHNKWLGVSAMFVRSSMLLLGLFKDFLITSAIKNSDTDDSVSDIRLLDEYMKSLFMLANHRLSFLLKLAIIPRKAIYRILGDLKTQAAVIINDCWNALGASDKNISISKNFGAENPSHRQLSCIIENPYLLKEIFIFAFHRNIDASKVGCKIIWSIALSCWTSTDSFHLLTNLALPELYNGYKSNTLYVDNYELERFTKCMLYTIHLPTDEKIYHSVLDMLKPLLGFLHIIADAYKIPEQKEFDDDRTALQIEMFSYLLNADRPELFLKMINGVFVHFLRKKDYVQAALSLEMLANTYAWNPNDLLPAIPFPLLPAQSSFERKEYLYKKAAEYFAKGSKLEKALAINKDLATAYDQVNYDLEGLSFVHGQISRLYKNLQTVDRLVPTYFKVSFMGFGFPISLRNKIFIFEGLPFEHISSMHSRLLRVHHGSTIVQTQAKVDELLLSPPVGKFIHVSTVEPQLNISEEYTNSSKIDSLNNRVRMYIENRELKIFTNSRRLPGAKGVTDLWVEEYTYVTASTFPTLMNRSEVKQVDIKKLSPIQNAIKTLQLKIQELNGLENMCYRILKDKGSSADLFEELSRNIAGTIDAPINGGMSKYREFLEPTIASQVEPNELKKLTRAFDELAMVLGGCLVLHLQLLPSKQYQQAHNVLVHLFEVNYTQEIERNSIVVRGMTLDMLTKSVSQQSSQKHMANLIHGSHDVLALTTSYASHTELDEPTILRNTSNPNSHWSHQNSGETIADKQLGTGGTESNHAC